MLADIIARTTLTSKELNRKYSPYLYAGYKTDCKGNIYLIAIKDTIKDYTVLKLGFTSNTVLKRVDSLFHKWVPASKYEIHCLDKYSFDSLELAYRYEQRPHKDLNEFSIQPNHSLRTDLRSGHTELYTTKLLDLL